MSKHAASIAGVSLASFTELALRKQLAIVATHMLEQEKAALGPHPDPEIERLAQKADESLPGLGKLVRGGQLVADEPSQDTTMISTIAGGRVPRRVTVDARGKTAEEINAELASMKLEGGDSVTILGGDMVSTDRGAEA